EWQRGYVCARVLDSAIEHWTNHLGSAPLLTVQELPFAYRDQARSSGSTGLVTLTLDMDVVCRLRSFARLAKVTLYVVILTALVVALYVQTWRERISLAGHFANRDRRGTRDMMGPLSHVHILSIDCPRDASLANLVQRVAVAVAGAMAHQDVPWELVSTRIGFS